MLDRGSGAVRHRRFTDLPDLVSPGDLLVLNDSRVIPARLRARRRGGGAAEVLLVTRETDGAWRAMVRPGARIRSGSRLDLGDDDAVEILAALPDGQRRVRLEGPGGDAAVIGRRGLVPLPPYIRREPTEADRERYQTVYASEPGSVAAPTAGLHFTPAVLSRLAARGVEQAYVTLHVGPGTFRPVTVQDAERHQLDPEAYVLPAATAHAVTATHRRGGAVWAVGTTVTRTLEACADPSRGLRAGAGWTSLFLRPGHKFQVVDRLITNFHLPRSTLLMLVCAFAGREPVLAAYAEAMREKYRFYSYGDAMVIL